MKDKQVEREYSYIPFRYILAVLITLLEIAAIIGIVFALCYYVPYFYLAAWTTQICCVVRIIASDDNPDYKVPWLLVVTVLPVIGFKATAIAEAAAWSGALITNLIAYIVHIKKATDKSTE